MLAVFALPLVTSLPPGKGIVFGGRAVAGVPPSECLSDPRETGGADCKLGADSHPGS